MSLIVQTLTSAQGSSNYAQINDLIGQIKTQLLNVPIVTIMSDNNPAATTARIIKFKVGTSQHYYILQANGYSACKIDIDNIAHSLTTYGLAYSINSNRDGSGGPIQNGNLYILHSDSVFVMWVSTWTSNIGGSSYHDLPVYVKNTDGSWYALLTCYDFGIYVDSSDTQGGGVNLTMLSTVMNGYDSAGNYYPIKAKYVLGSQIQTYEPIALFCIYMTGLANWSVYSDGTYNWMTIAAGSYIFTDHP